MAGEWAETTLGGVADVLSGGTPSKDRADYWGGAIPWVSAKDMKRFRLEDTEDHVTDDGAESGTRVVPSGTVLLLARGMTNRQIGAALHVSATTVGSHVEHIYVKAGVRSRAAATLFAMQHDLVG